MKTIKNLTIILVVLSTLLMGCKSTETKTPTEESAYPLDESYPVEDYYYNDYTGDNAAYPVFPIDVTQLTIVPVWTPDRLFGQQPGGNLRNQDLHLRRR